MFPFSALAPLSYSAHPPLQVHSPTSQFPICQAMSVEHNRVPPSLQVSLKQPNTRSELDILISCWTTIFICTWVSIHPNIPPSGKTVIRTLWRRITLMFWALIVPELILAWAVRQWLVARAIVHEFRGKFLLFLPFVMRLMFKRSPITDHKWTMAHAHFLGMGGFTLVDPGEPAEGLELPDLREINLPNIPVQPKVPVRSGDGDSAVHHYFDELNDYWVNARKLYAEDRKKFWEGWECVQRKCSVYSNFIPKSVRDRSLIRMDEEDYSRYERYGYRLLPNITYLRESPGTLTFYRFRDLAATSTITFPTITAEEIIDKSKGDLLSKAIAILHTTWFIVQCVARPSQGLAITELELATLAIASLNVVTYFLWWDKPLDVKEPVKVYFRGAVPVEDRQVSFSPYAYISFICDTLVKGPLVSSTSTTFLTSITNFFQTQQMKTSNPWCLPFRLLIYLPVTSLVESIYAIIDTAEIPPGATHVPKFYATNVSSSNVDVYFMYFALPIITIVFGGLHCFGWNFTFPTPAEQTLWRVASLLITVIPLVAGLVLSLNHHWGQLRSHDQRGEESKALKMLLYPAFILLVVYVLARLSLLIQALVLLRKQPTSAYVAVDWSRFLPHISMN